MVISNCNKVVYFKFYVVLKVAPPSILVLNTLFLSKRLILPFILASWEHQSVGHQMVIYLVRDLWHQFR